MLEQPSEFVTRPRRPLLRRAEASQYLLEVWGIKRTTGTLAKLAVTGAGPKFYKANRLPMYGPDHLDEWAVELLGDPCRSTADADSASAKSAA
jgi:hypothetical protein